MSTFAQTLGLGKSVALPPLRHAVTAARLQTPLPAERPDLKERIYAAHVLGQLIDTAAEELERDSRFMKHIQFEKRAESLHKKTDDLVGVLFEAFSASEADSLNALAATCQAAVVSIIKLAINSDGSKGYKQKVNRAYLLLNELAGLAGVRTT